MTASYNGSLPQPAIQPTDIVVKEDNTTVPIQLEGCDDSQEAAIVFCVDVSTSMRSSAGDLFDIAESFFRCFGSCFVKLRPTSRYALVPFTDIVQGVFPGAGRPGGFYSVSNPADSAEFTNILKGEPYFGPTYVDHAIDSAIQLLQYQPFENRVIILVTDDNVIDIDKYDSLMQLYHITFYTMEVGSDNSPLNVKLTHQTGGAYYQASDSGNFEPVMGQLAELISSEHCVIRYVSPNSCPWFASHDINMTLNYKSLSRLSLQSYTFGRNIFDKTGPVITESSPSFISRLVDVSDNFPCSRGLYYAYDSVRENFILRSRRQFFTHFFPKINGVYKDSSYFQLEDSLVVLDSMQRARTIYIALDSANNKTVQEVIYQPAPDIKAPVLSLAQSTSKNVTIAASEVQAWDRGLKDIRLAAGATNIVLDSIHIYSKRTGNAWLHIPDVSIPVHGCIEAEDSVGNIGSYCIDRDKPVSDVLPPEIAQLPISEPIKTITATIAEQRPLDVGIKAITIEPAANIGTPGIQFISRSSATVTVPILDSLQPVRAWISAADSVGNAAIDTLRYDPKPDDNAPVCTIETPSSSSRLIRVTEASPWDRGVASITTLGAVQNLTPGPVIFIDRWQATQTFSVIDPTLPASAVVRGADSLGQECVSTISISPGATPLAPLQVVPTVDFLSHQAPFDSTATVIITNPNAEPVVITKMSLTGDSVFTAGLVTPLVFQPSEQKSISIRFNTALLGSWNGQLTVSNDTMLLATIQAKGITTGHVSISISSANVAYAPNPSSISLVFTAQPSLINIDTIAFDLQYNGDLAEFSYPIIDCGTQNPLCNYNMQAAAVSNGVMHFALTRNDRTILSAFSDTVATIRMPFVTFVTKVAFAPISIAQPFAGAFTVLDEVDTGVISVGDRCGDPDIRATLNHALAAHLQSIVPNPASSSVAVTITSSYSQEQPATLVLIDQLGNVIIRKPIVLKAGTSQQMLSIEGISTGNYILSLSAAGSSSVQSLPLKIVR